LLLFVWHVIIFKISYQAFKSLVRPKILEHKTGKNPRDFVV